MKKYIIPVLLMVLAGCSLTENVEGGGSKILTESVNAGRYLWSEANYTVYLPKDFKKDENLPVLYLCHGANGNHMSWPGKARGVEFKQMLDELIDNNVIQRIIVVGLEGRINGNAGLTDWAVTPGGQTELVESALFEYEIPHIELRFGTRMRERHERFIAGQSAGGAATTRLMWTRWQWFGGAIAMSPVPGMSAPLAATSLAVLSSLNANIDLDSPDNQDIPRGPDGRTFVLSPNFSGRTSIARSQTNSWVMYTNDIATSIAAGVITSTYAPERAGSAAAGVTMEGRAMQKTRFVIVHGDTDDLLPPVIVPTITTPITNAFTAANVGNVIEVESFLLPGVTHYSHWSDLDILKTGLLWMFKK